MGKFAKKLAVFLVTILIGGLAYGGIRQALAYAPDNPMEEPVGNYSPIAAEEENNTGTGTGKIYFDINSEENPEEEKEETEISPDDSQGGAGEAGEIENGGDGTAEDGSGSAAGGHETIRVTDKTKDDPENSRKEKNYNGYFSTSIEEGETVSSQVYEFTITQKEHDLKVEEIQVKINGKTVNGFQGKVYLEEGKNTISITITYTDEEENRTFDVSRSYHVNVVLKEIAINTNLKDGTEVSVASFGFTATANADGESVPLVVTLNGAELENSYSGYHCQLEEGSNEIRLKASAPNGKEKEEIYRIIYNKPQSEYKIETNLKDQEVHEAEFSFQVSVTYGGESTDEFSVRLNGQEIFGENGIYRGNLVEGDNPIDIIAGNGEGQYVESYTVNYVIIEDGGGDEDPSKRKPLMNVTGIGDGLTVKDTVWNFEMSSVDYKGNRIHADGISVVCNGEPAHLVYDDDVRTSYRLSLVSGDNIVTITVTDSAGNVAVGTFHLNCTAVEDGAVIGTAVFSLEATTVGLGYLIPPTQVEIHQGENAAYVLVRWLEANGFSYTNSGTLDTNFYLATVIRPGIITNPVLSEDLAAQLTAHGCEYDMSPNGYDNNPDDLGEFDFTDKSGWMYSINGSYPNYSFSDAYLTDGSVVRVRFTTYLGSDIGGGYAAGGDGNWGDW